MFEIKYPVRPIDDSSLEFPAYSVVDAENKIVCWQYYNADRESRALAKERCEKTAAAINRGIRPDAAENTSENGRFFAESGHGKKGGRR